MREYQLIIPFALALGLAACGNGGSPDTRQSSQRKCSEVREWALQEQNRIRSMVEELHTETGEERDSGALGLARNQRFAELMAEVEAFENRRKVALKYCDLVG